MSQPDVNGDRPEAATTAWGDGGSEETQVIRPRSQDSDQGASDVPDTGSGAPNTGSSAAAASGGEADRLYSGSI